MRAVAITFAICVAFVANPHGVRAQDVLGDTVGACWNYRTPDASFRAEIVASGLKVPVSLAFLSDGRALVAERPVGKLDFVDLRSGAITPIDGVPAVVGQVDGGMLEIVAHPDYARNHVIYYAYAEPTDSGNAAVVERARIEGTHLVDRKRLLSVRPYIDNVNQFGARIVLSHGFLYIAIGDRELPALAQDLTTDAGKIVRIREDGSIPADNPFVRTKSARPEIWSLGHRNPQGLAIDPRTGELWEHEHGPRGGDEINIIRPGHNYGWPVITYGIEYSGERVGAGLTRQEGMEQPVYYYVPSIAPSGMAFYSGADFSRWRNNIFLGSMSFRHLNRVVLRGDRVVREERLLRDRGWRIREVRQGNDGLLYLGVESGLLVRIRPTTEASDARAHCAKGTDERDSWTTSPASTPSIESAGAAYDADGRRLIVAGVVQRGDVQAGGTWQWAGGAWSEVDSALTPARSGQAMATDPAGGVLLFGGIDHDSTRTDESWHYTSRKWTALTAPGPRARANAAMAFDLDHHRSVLWGGAPCIDRALWSWDGHEWTMVDINGPLALRDAAMAYDPTTRSLVLVGGRHCSGRPSHDAWRWDGKRWSQLALVSEAQTYCLVYSPTRNRTLLFAIDSAVPGSAWQLRGSRWESIPQRPPALSDATCAVDVAGERIVLVGRPPAATSPRTYLLLR
ncbi:MAG TPA: PQQ-dependent sugar dehydrogenase [Gemmatimonadaceae bacterium]|nr:PQQ-dependent sugar dehydrogenase [Gemmatimonadaceae bacterium]